MSRTNQLESFKDILSIIKEHGTYQGETNKSETDRSMQVVVLPDMDWSSPDMPQRKEGNKTVYMKPLTCILSPGPQPGQVRVEVTGLEMYRAGDGESSTMSSNMYTTVSIVNDVNGEQKGAVEVQRISYILKNKKTRINFKKPEKEVKNVAESIHSGSEPQTSNTTKTKNESKCLNCGIVCKSEQELTSHIQMLHKLPDYLARKSQRSLWLCDKCPFKTWRNYDIPIHKMKHKVTDIIETDEQGNVCCKLCPRVVSTKEEIYKHLLKEHEPFVSGALKKCWICTKVFADQRILVRHITEVHEKVKPYHCKRCGLAFTRRRNLTSHKERTKRTKCVCTKCLTPYHSRCDLEIHYKTHDDKLRPESEPQLKILPPKTKCEICNRIVTKFSRKDHMKEFHDIIEEFKCEHCNKGYHIKASLKQHIRQIHINRKCGVCGIEFVKKKHFAQHIKDGGCTKP